ncbi:MAG: hypothetical protein CVT47_02730 [Thermoplasmata archaeon HGW-Thermoplasmata-2]|nr:MAG: hypothetical protein CVT47_02730 [Thermoplasmata archaeon HGW-Thermoplasmata-2]
MKYPPEVLTVSKKGKTEVRHLIDKGKFVRYDYLDSENGKPVEESKVKLVLIAENGATEEFFVIPMKGGARSLMLKAEEKGERKIWDGEKAVEL